MRNSLLCTVMGVTAMLASQSSEGADEWCSFVVSPRIRLREKPSVSAPLVKWNPSTVPLRMRFLPDVNSLQVVDNERWLRVQNGWVREEDVVSVTDAVDHFRSAAPSAFLVASLSRAYGAQGKTAEAVAEAKRAVEMDPNYVPAYLAHGVALRAARDFAAAESALMHAAVCEPDWCEPSREYAELLVMLKRNREAAHFYGNAIRLSPDRNYTLYLARGMAWRNCDELEASRRDLLAASKMPGASAEVLSELHITAERIRIAESSEWLKREPNASGAYLNRANTYGGLGEIDRALSDYAMALQLGERRFAVCASRAQLWLREGEYGRAIADLEAALQDNSEVGVQRTLAWVLATCPNEKHRDGRRAVAIAKDACEATSWSITDFIVCLGAAYAESGDFASAIKEEKRALKLVKSLDGDAAAEIFLEESKPRLDAYRAARAWRDGAPPREGSAILAE